MDDYKSTDRSIYSRWASPVEIKASLYRVETNGNPKFGGIPLYCEDGVVYADHLDSHTLIASATASKKTRNIGMPALQILALAGESFIATDPKAELYEKTLLLLKKQGYDIFVLNLREPQKSNCWNPLKTPYDLYKQGNRDLAIEIIVDMSNSFIQDNSCPVAVKNDSYWHNNASNLLAAFILILFECADENQIHFKSLRSLRKQALKQDLKSDKNKSEYTPPFIAEDLDFEPIFTSTVPASFVDNKSV